MCYFYLSFQLLRRGGRLPSRDELESVVLANQPIVFSNAAGFLRIEAMNQNDYDYEPLDGTRIHPDDYNLARKIAQDALEKDKSDPELIQELMDHRY